MVRCVPIRVNWKVYPLRKLDIKIPSDLLLWSSTLGSQTVEYKVMEYKVVEYKVVSHNETIYVYQ